MTVAMTDQGGSTAADASSIKVATFGIGGMQLRRLRQPQ